MDIAAMINRCFRHQHPEAYGEMEVAEPELLPEPPGMDQRGGPLAQAEDGGRVADRQEPAVAFDQAGADDHLAQPSTG